MTALSSPAFANCVLQPDGVTVICTTNAPNPYTSSINAITVGTGTLVIPGNGAKVIVNAGAGIATTGAAVQVNNNSSVTNSGSISTTFINAYGIWAGDPNNASSTTVGFGNTLENDGTIRTNGSNSVGMFARTANRTAGNVLINRGRIDTFGSISGTSPRSSSAGIRSQDRSQIAQCRRHGNAFASAAVHDNRNFPFDAKSAVNVLSALVSFFSFYYNFFCHVFKVQSSEFMVQSHVTPALTLNSERRTLN